MLIIFSFKKLWDHFSLSLDHSVWFIAKTTQKIAQFRIKIFLKKLVKLQLVVTTFFIIFFGFLKSRAIHTIRFQKFGESF